MAAVRILDRFVDVTFCLSHDIQKNQEGETIFLFCIIFANSAIYFLTIICSLAVRKCNSLPVVHKSYYIYELSYVEP